MEGDKKGDLSIEGNGTHLPGAHSCFRQMTPLICLRGIGEKKKKTELPTSPERRQHRVNKRKQVTGRKSCIPERGVYLCGVGAAMLGTGRGLGAGLALCSSQALFSRITPALHPCVPGLSEPRPQPCAYLNLFSQLLLLAGLSRLRVSGPPPRGPAKAVILPQPPAAAPSFLPVQVRRRQGDH